jgi:phasin family protein
MTAQTKILFDPAVFASFKAPTFDVDAIIAIQRKNLEALTKANQALVAGVQAVTQRSAEILRQAAEEAPQVLRSFAETGTAETFVEKQVELAKRGFAQATATTRELADIIAKAQAEATDVVSKRIGDSLDEVRGLAKPAAKAKKAS